MGGKMSKVLKRVLLVFLFLAALRAPLAQAAGGLVFRPYWTLETKSPVIRIQTGDTNGDGTPEVILLTADDWVYVLDNDGTLAWRYEVGLQASTLLVTDLDGDGKDDIFVGGKLGDTLLSEAKEPVWTYVHAMSEDVTLTALAADLNEDGRQELLTGILNAAIFLDLEGSRRGPLLHQFATGQSVPNLWAGEVDGDGRLEIVPSNAGGHEVDVWKDNFMLAWRHTIEGQVALVQGGDVDGDGRAELAVLTTSWDLLLLDNDGRQLWRQPVAQADTPPVPGQLLLQDLTGGRPEIIVLAGATVYIFDGAGQPLRQQTLGAGETATVEEAAGATRTRLPANFLGGDVDGDGRGELLAAIPARNVVYLLDALGQPQVEYHPSTDSGGTTGAIAYADLNGDHHGEVLIGTQMGVQVFGAASQVERGELWHSPMLGTAGPLDLADLNGNGRTEVVAASQEGYAYGLTDDGFIEWKVDLEGAAVLALASGDVDGDGRAEIAVATIGGAKALGGGQLFLLKDHRPAWSIPIGLLAKGVAIADLGGDGQAEIIVGGNLHAGNKGGVMVFDSQGKLAWQQQFDHRVTAIGPQGDELLVGTTGGQVYRLTAAGAVAGVEHLESEVLAVGEGLAATAAGGIYRLAAGGPVLLRQLDRPAKKVYLAANEAVVLTGDQDLSLVVGKQLLWQEPLAIHGVHIAARDPNGGGAAEVAVSADDRRVHLFGLAASQPPFLSQPDLAETRTGYTYRVKVNNPEAKPITVTLEIWDPSAGVWLTGVAQSHVQDQGRVNLNVADPFDTWDSGQESRYRFRYDDGYNQGVLAATPGPLTIPTLPWYLYFGQFVGLGVLALLVPALGGLLYRRQRAFRRSPVGRAESLLQQLRARPAEALPRLRDLAHDDPAALAYLPGLAHEANELALATLSNGFHLILTQPEVVAEGLKAVVRGGAAAASVPGAVAAGQGGEAAQVLASLYSLCLAALEANTVARIVGLHAQLAGQSGFSAIMMPTGPSATTEAVTTTVPALAELGRVGQSLLNYERVETVEDKIAYLAQALELLGRLDREFQATLPQPERTIFSRIALTWLTVTTNALEDLQGRAQIEVALKTRQVLSFGPICLSLELTNTGRSPASNLTISLNPDQGSAVGNSPVRLDIVPAGRSVVVELPVSVAPSVEQFRAEFAITFDDRERSGKQVAFADLVRLLKPAAPFRPVPNPYAPGTPLRPGSPLFFGRDDLFQFIAENMGGPTRPNILVLIGQRRMGKTSFLRQLPARLDPAYLPVYLDGQSLGIDPGMASFFYDLSLAIAEAVANQGLAIAAPQLTQFQERPRDAFERIFLPAVFKAIDRQRLLLLFDEFEELEMRVAAGKLEPAIFSFFRHLMQHEERLGFIFVGTRRLEELTAAYWSILFNIALYKHITFLTETAARTLIVEPVAPYGLLYDDLALDKIVRVTAGQPYFLQLICHTLVNGTNRARRNYVTIRDVNDTLVELVELGEAHFAFLWEQSSPPEQLTLAALMHLLAKTPAVTVTPIVDLLAERGLTLELPAVLAALQRLIDRDIVRELPGPPPRYEYKVDLVRLWVERHKTLGRVTEVMGRP